MGRFNVPMAKRSTHFICATLTLTLVVLAGCSSGTSDTPATEVLRSEIHGRVIDAISGEPISSASIRTDPPSEEVITGIDGEFSLRLNSGVVDPVRVVVSHFAYADQQTEVTPILGDTARVDFALQSSAIGLHANTSTLVFEPGVNRQTLLLSSNVQDTAYSVFPTDPWVSVIPSSGLIANRETVVLEVSIDRSLVPSTPAQSLLVINAGNGTRELVISVLARTDSSVMQGSESAADTSDDEAIQGNTTDDASESVDNGQTVTAVRPHANQDDCRRPDILRLVFGSIFAPTFIFEDSFALPADSGLYEFNTVGNPFVISSVAIAEAGKLTLDHVSGGLSDTTLEVFDVDALIQYRSLAVNNGKSEEDLRAAIVDLDLIPGIYCFFLSGTQQNFTTTQRLQVNMRFAPNN